MSDRQLDRRLEAAAARSPEVAAMVAGKHDGLSARYRRVLVLVAAAALGVTLLWGVLAFRPGAAARQARSEPAEEIDRSEYLSQIRTEPGGAGEEVAPFAGFALSVETEPPGALVSIRGVPRGEAPVLANVECRGPEKIEIRAEKAGFGAARKQLGCRSDTLVKLTLRLAK